MRRIICLLPALLLLTMLPLPSYGQESQPEVRLENAQQEARARELFRNLRCEVCEGQTIADSNADLAQDMRRAVRGKVAEGQSDAEIMEYFASRYGRDILMQPPLDVSTAPLWLAPLFIIMLGAWFVMRYFSRRKNSHF